MKVIWIVDYIGGGRFKAKVSKESDFTEDLSKVDYNVVDTNLDKIRERTDIITRGVVSTFDHYGKFEEDLDIRYEFTEECISQLESMIKVKSNYGCMFIILLLWFILYFGFILVKWLIVTVWPSIKVFLLIMLSKI